MGNGKSAKAEDVTKVVAEFDMDAAMDALLPLDRALLGSILGTAAAMESDIVGLSPKVACEAMRHIEEDLTFADILGAIDRLGQIEVTIPLEGGGSLRANMALAVGAITDADGEIEVVLLAVPARVGEAL